MPILSLPTGCIIIPPLKTNDRGNEDYLNCSNKCSGITAIRRIECEIFLIRLENV